MLAIDTDPQGNLSNSFARERTASRCVDRLLDPSAEPDVLKLIHRTKYPHLDVIPASPLLARYDVSDQRVWEETDMHHSFIEPIRMLRPLYDYIVFDCPPRLSLVSFAALCASDFAIVPLEAADWGAQGVMQVTAAIEHVQQRFNRNLVLLGYLISRFKSRRSYQQSYLTQLREQFGPRTFDVMIPDLAAFERAVTDAVPITRHNPTSPAAGIAREFFDEVAERIAKARAGGAGGRSPDAHDECAVAV